MSSISKLTGKKVYLVGIKGVAMTSLAQCLADLNIEVLGSDVAEDFVTEKILADHNFTIFTDFTPEHISKDLALIIYTGAHQGANNVEVKRAKELGIPTMTHAAALGDLMQGKRGISVCGTGGKSTTSAMIAWILESAGLQPSYAIGVGNVTNLGRTGRYAAESEFFVAEADEFAVDPTHDLRPRFIYQHPEVIVCTNLKYDHPDIYPTYEKMQDTFLSFFNTLPDGGLLVINGEDGELVKLCKQVRSGIKVIAVVESEAESVVAKMTTSLLVAGDHNKRNAAAAYTVASSLGIEQSKILEALASFQGTMRRFESKPELEGMLMFDDYAHTPEEIEATLGALKDQYPEKQIIAVFQPHTYSRTKALFSGFSRSFSKADEVILMDIYGSARETADPSMSSELLASAIEKNEIGKDVGVVHSFAELADTIRQVASSDSCLITMGAGDVYKIHDQIRDGE